MKNLSITICLLFLVSIGNAQTTKALPRPKLVVGIVVDQMRWDYLYRYYDRYSTGGFKRLLHQGFSCENTMINYSPSYTAPGHAGIYTGSVPSIHGIAGNDWIDNQTGRHWYCVEDTNVVSIGGSKASGKMSPNNLLATTITDELRLATNFKSKVIGISIKDRGSILPAGHLGKAYWLDDSTGNLITSSYYSNELPEWVNQMNKRQLINTYMSKPWNTLYPLATYTQSLPDNNPYEGGYKKEQTPVFPYDFTNNKLKNFRKTPWGNTFTFEAARAAIEGEQLGSSSTDFLCISLSSTDYIGHQFGPNSVEIEDTYLRLDQELAAFLLYLDKTIGKNNYTIFLTADHGAAHNAQFLEDLPIPAGNESERKLANEMNDFLYAETGLKQIIRGMENYQLFINESLLVGTNFSKSLIKEKLKSWLLKRSHVAYVLDMEAIYEAPIPAVIKTKAINGYHRNRSGELLVINNPGWYYGYGKTGTTHSTWHPYDTHIPLLFYGWGIKKGTTYKTYHMEDIATTLAAILHIQMPNGCVGQVISEILK